MTKKILSIHETVLDFLLSLHQKDESFLFVPRKIDNKNRLSDGYWFRGNDQYMEVSFWGGNDWKEKIHNICFVVGVKLEPKDVLRWSNKHKHLWKKYGQIRISFVRWLLSKLLNVVKQAYEVNKK